MKKQMKKGKTFGFTLTELIIVIVIIAILAAIMVPSYTGYVKKAKYTVDTTLVKQLNDALIDAENDPIYSHNTLSEVAVSLTDYGFILANLQAKSENNTLVWNQVTNRFYILGTDSNGHYTINTVDNSADPSEILYPANNTENKYLIDAKNTFWVIYTKDVDGLVSISLDSDSGIKTISSDYSVYLGTTVTGDIATDKGVDVGNNKDISSITYNNQDVTQNSIIYTNGGNLIVNALYDDVSHYGSAKKVSITLNSEDNTYKECGEIEYITLTSGCLSIDKNASIDTLVITGPSNAKIDGAVDEITHAYTTQSTIAEAYENITLLNSEQEVLDTECEACGHIYNGTETCATCGGGATYVDDSNNYRYVIDEKTTMIVWGSGEMETGDDAVNAHLSQVGLDNHITHLVISEGVTSIGYNAFSGMKNLETVVLPETIIYIARYAFYNDTSLVSINFPSSLKSIGEYAFSYTNLEVVDLSKITDPNKGVTAEECKYDSVSFHTTLLEPGCFSRCGMKKVILPNGVKMGSEGIFSQCSNLIEIELGKPIQLLATTPSFGLCGNVTTITYDGTVAEWESLQKSIVLGKMTFGPWITGISENTKVKCTNGYSTIYAYNA